MPMEKTTSSFAGSFRAHANDETQFREDFSELPGGIVGGTAELREAKLGTYKSTPATAKSGLAGKPFLFLSGRVLEPTVAIKTEKRWEKGPDGKGQVVIVGKPLEVKVQGLPTNQTLPLCDTVRTVQGQKEVVSKDENISVAMNELRTLGGPECLASLAALPANATDDQAKAALTVVLDAIKRAKVRFRFGTQSGDPNEQYPTPRTWHRWYGAVESPNGQAHHDDPTAGVGAAPDSTDANADGAADEPAADAESAGDDLDALVTAADGGDKDAKSRLLELAVAGGASKEQAEAANTWREVADMAAAGQEAADETPAEEEEVPVEEEEWMPKVTEVYGYKPKVKGKDGKVKPASKAVDCEVKAVNAEKQTVELLNGVDKKTTYKNIPFDALIRDE